MTHGERVAAGARALVGCRFRLQGRDPDTGLDCVGVAAAALASAGREGAVPGGYPLRCGAWRGTAPGDLLPADGERAGDILLCRVAASQLHVVVRTAAGFVHADAALRRVVERPGAPPWPMVRAWRVGEGEG